MVDGFYVNTYEDKGRDSVFVDTLDQRLRSAGLMNIDPTMQLSSIKDEKILFKAFREKINYNKDFDEWFEKENNGLQDKVRLFISNIN